MAMKIPDAPNVIGTQPVLREIDSINPVSERPNFRVDVSAPVEAVKNVGNAYADYVEYNTNICSRLWLPYLFRCARIDIL